MNINLANIKTLLKSYSNPKDIGRSKIIFQAIPGKYGEGDIFLGITNPQLHKIAKQFISLDDKSLQKLISFKFHEERFLAISILLQRLKKKISEEQLEKIYNFYVDNLKHINNWDLVDCSAPHISGRYLFDKDRNILFDWAQSSNVWLRRISIISTFYFIRKNDFKDSLKIATLLLNDNHDLIHKAVGWMLREIGKRNLETEVMFLEKHHKKMPRIMLQYAMEKFEKEMKSKFR